MATSSPTTPTPANTVADQRTPFAEPATGVTVEVAPGIHWLRLALPFRLDHVNVFLLEDGDGYTLIDTGIGDAATRAVWQRVLRGLDRPVARIIATHYHPDHVGMAGELCAETGAPLLMALSEFLTSQIIQLDPQRLDSEPYRSLYRGHGLDAATTDALLGQGQGYLRMVTGLPRTFRRLIAGESLRIGGRRFDILTGGGHSPEQVMLHCADDRLLLAADQVMTRISPNISVQATDPEGDPLGIYLRSLAALERLDADTLVLPGHHLPFYGLRERTRELAAHHASRCEAVLSACTGGGRSAAELIPVLFRRPIDDPHQMGFAFSEALAHVNYLVRQGALRRVDGRFVAIS